MSDEPNLNISLTLNDDHETSSSTSYQRVIVYTDKPLDDALQFDSNGTEKLTDAERRNHDDVRGVFFCKYSGMEGV